MAKQPPAKRRTREHVIADLSENYVQRFFFERGHTCSRVEPDYGYDFYVCTYDLKGYIENSWLYIQVKATDNIGKYSLDDDEVFSFRVDIASYNQYVRETVPVYFVLFDAQKRQAHWINARTYFRDRAKTKKIKKTQKGVQIHVPRKNVMDLTVIDEMRQEKNVMAKRIQTALD